MSNSTQHPPGTVAGYIALVLNENSHAQLLKEMPSAYPKTYAHHVTLAYAPTQEEYAIWENVFGNQVSFEVVGIAKNDRVQAALVRMEVPSQNEFPHITISTNNAPPQLSNELFTTTAATPCEPIQLSGTIQFFPFQEKPNATEN